MLEPPAGVDIQFGPWYSYPAWKKALVWLRWQSWRLPLVPLWWLRYRDRFAVTVMWRRNHWKMGRWSRWVPGRTSP